MKKTFKTTLAAAMVSALALVPVATVATVAFTDVAYAKSDKSNGNGGKSSEARGKSASAKDKSKGKSGTKGKSGGSKSASAKSGGGSLEGLFGKLTGQEKKAAKAKVRTASAPATSAPAKARPAKGSGMHPSELGKMNGALNANVNAILAHIRNGNTNGPIGGMAALAIANDGAIGAEDLIALDDLFMDLSDALGEGGTVEGYYQSLLDAQTNAENPDVVAALEVLEGDPENVDALQVLEDNGFGDAEDPAAAYEQSLVDALADARDPDVDAAIDALGGDSANLVGLPDDVVDPTDEERMAAEDALQDQVDAEENMLTIWNKNENDPSVRTEEEIALLEKLNERLAADGEAIAATIAEVEAEMEDDMEDIADCDGEEVCPPVEDELAELAE